MKAIAVYEVGERVPLEAASEAHEYVKVDKAWVKFY